jgi:hypothetical protein
MHMSSFRTTYARVRGSARRALRGLSACRGQGTVEYVGIVIVIGVLLVALKAGMGDQGGTIAHKISKSVSDAIQNVMDNKGSGKG